jgi:hypothetical protein
MLTGLSDMAHSTAHSEVARVGDYEDPHVICETVFNVAIVECSTGKRSRRTC